MLVYPQEPGEPESKGVYRRTPYGSASQDTKQVGEEKGMALRRQTVTHSTLGHVKAQSTTLMIATQNSNPFDPYNTERKQI